MSLLEIKNLHATVAGREILKGIDLTINAGEVHAIMGPNGSGKSTLAQVLSGRDLYQVTGGEVTYDGKDLLEMSPEDRAREGIFMAFQYPVEIPGVSNLYFLKAALNAIRKHQGLSDLDAMDFLALVKEKMALMEMDESLLNRAVNTGFSGGEKKRNEIFQMAVLEPKLAILDETDSGLDIDALKIVANGVNALRSPAARHDRGDALPAPAELHRAGFRARAGRGPHREIGRQRTGARTGRDPATSALRRRSWNGMTAAPARFLERIREDARQRFSELGLSDHPRRRLALHQRRPHYPHRHFVPASPRAVAPSSHAAT